VGTAIAKRRTRPGVVILDARFATHLVHPSQLQLTAVEFIDAARRIVTDVLDHLDVSAGGASYRVRIAPMLGPDPFRYAMVVERRGWRRPLLEAYDRFDLSAREIEVLAMIVGGASNREIGGTLCIVPGTVQDHVRSLCTKNRAKRRGDLLARVFGVGET
jgi:DNA-binding CsgD family transcriptional regulator